MRQPEPEPRGVHPSLTLDTSLFDNPLEQSYQLGLTLRSVSSALMPASWLHKLQARLTDAQVDILPNYQDWFLCETAEARLASALTKQATMLINDTLLLKFVGRQCALCVTTTATASGTFVAGNWYAPSFAEEVWIVRDAFDEGEGRLPLEPSTWTLLRGMQGDLLQRTDLLAQARAYAVTHLTILPARIDGMVREDFRCQKEEKP